MKNNVKKVAIATLLSIAGIVTAVVLAMHKEETTPSDPAPTDNVETNVPLLGGVKSEELVYNGNVVKYNDAKQTKAWTIKPAQINYKESDSSWNPINLAWEDKVTHFEMSKSILMVKAPKFADLSLSVIDTDRFDIFGKKDITDAPFEVLITPIGVSHASGIKTTLPIVDRDGYKDVVEAVVYQNAFPDADLIYYLHNGETTEVEKIVRWNTKPTCTVTKDVQFLISGSFAKVKHGQGFNTDWDNTKKTLNGSLLTQKTGARNIFTLPPKVWDSASSSVEIAFTIEPSGSDLLYTKKIDCSWFDGKTYPVYTDGTFAGNSTATDDCRMGKTAETSWSDARDTRTGDAGQTNCTSTGDASGAYSDETVGLLFSNFRVSLPFDTSAIEDTETVDAFDVEIYHHSLVDTTSSTQADFTAIYSHPMSSTVNDPEDYGAYVDLGTPATMLSAELLFENIVDANFNKYVGNSTSTSAISKTASSTLGYRTGFDGENIAPTANTVFQVDWRQGNHASSKPILNATTSVAASPETDVPTGSIPFFFLLVVPTRLWGKN